MIFKGGYIRKLAVDAALGETLHAMPSVEQRLLAQIRAELTDYRFPDTLKHAVFILAVSRRNGAYHLLKHQNIFYFGNFGHIDIAAAQIAHLLLAPAVTVDNAAAQQMMERVKIIERARRLDHLVTSAKRLDSIISEHKRIQFCVDRMLGVTLDEKHRFTGAHKSLEHFLVYSGIGLKHHIVPPLQIEIKFPHPHHAGISAR